MAAEESQSDYPQWWDWSEDGEEVAGRFVRLGQGFTAYGQKPFLVLDVEGVERTIWLHNQVLHNIFARELHRRPEKEFQVGERVEIRQLGTRDSASGREYMNYRGEFPDAPQSSQADILGPPPEPPAKQDDGSGDRAEVDLDDDIPFG
jgi:hypothetical protein